MSNKCPKCGEKLSPFYLKQNCPKCGVDLLYYRLEERLEEDAAESARQVEKINRFKSTLKESSVSSPLKIIRLILFFTPLASMCLPMYRADSKNVSLISVILSIVNHGFGINVWTEDYLFAFFAIAFVIVLSLAVIINSLFSATKKGTVRNFVFSLVNTFTFLAFSLLVCLNSGSVKIGFYVTLAIYLAELLLHFVTSREKPKALFISSVAISVILAAVCVFVPKTQAEKPEIIKGGDLTVVSFNTAAPWGTSFDDTAGEDRVIRFADYMKQASPELIGTQELNSSWLESLGTLLPEYESYAVKRGGDDDESRSEMNGIFWLKNRFTPLEKDTFWLSQTPEKESRFTYTDENGEEQEAGCNRICTYAVLSDNVTNKTVIFLNTHLDNSSEEARLCGSKLICEKIKELREKYADAAVVLSGDFNQTSDSDVYKNITEVLNDTTDQNKARATWQDWGYTDTGDQPIDFIFTSCEGINYQVLDYKGDGYISDHYGIKTDIVIK